MRQSYKESIDGRGRTVIVLDPVHAPAHARDDRPGRPHDRVRQPREGEVARLMRGFAKFNVEDCQRLVDRVNRALN